MNGCYIMIIDAAENGCNGQVGADPKGIALDLLSIFQLYAVVMIFA